MKPGLDYALRNRPAYISEDAWKYSYLSVLVAAESWTPYNAETSAIWYELQCAHLCDKLEEQMFSRNGLYCGKRVSFRNATTLTRDQLYAVGTINAKPVS